MFAYIKNNNIFTISTEKLSEEFLEKIGEKEEDFTILEFSNEIKNPMFKNWTIIETPREETPEEKRARVFQKFILSETLDSFDWEGIEPTEQDYNNLIVLRNFSGDAGSQVTMLTKAVFKILAILLEKKVIPLEELAMIFQEDLRKTQEISETRVALGLHPFDFSFLNKK